MEAKNSFFTVKNVLRVLVILSIVFIFCPSFLVSCSGQTVNVSVLTALEGVSAYGEKIVEPSPIMFLSILFPVCSLIALLIKSITNRRASSMILTFMIADTIVWFIFRSAVKSIADQNYCSFKTTAWYIINIIVHLALIIISALVFINKIQMDLDLAAVLSSNGTKAAGSLNNNSSQKATGQCPNCGAIIKEGSKFCNSCGTPISESLFAKAPETEQTKMEQEGQKDTFCPNCGAKIDQDAVFCTVCGAKIKK